MIQSYSVSSLLASAFAFAALASQSTSQCVSQWGPGIPGINGGVSSCATAPNGDSVVGGFFSTIAGTAANRIAVRDSATGAFSALGTGVGSLVEVVSVRSNGNILAGGNLTTAGGVPVTSIAEFDGSTWSPIGAGGAPPGSTARCARLRCCQMVES